MQTTTQEKIKNRRLIVGQSYDTLRGGEAVTALVNYLSKRFKVSTITIYNDIKVWKVKQEAINFTFTEQTTPDEWFDLCNRYAKSIGYCTSGNFDDYLDQYDDGETPYDTINDYLMYNQ